MVDPVASQAHWHHGPSAGVTPDGYKKRCQTAHHTGERPYVTAAGARQEKNDGLCSWLKEGLEDGVSAGEPPAGSWVQWGGSTACNVRRRSPPLHPRCGQRIGPTHPLSATTLRHLAGGEWLRDGSGEPPHFEVHTGSISKIRQNSDGRQ